MGAFTTLNNYANTSVAFTVDTQQISRTVGASFDAPFMTWDVIRQLGPLTGNGVRIDYNVQSVANTQVQFPFVGDATHTLTISEPSTGVFRIQGMLDIIDYEAARASITPPVGYTGNVDYTQTYTNTVSGSADFVVSTRAVP